ALLRSRSLSGLGDEPAIITGLNWDERAGTFRIGTYGGVTLTWPEKEPAPLATLAFPVSQQVRVGEALYVLEVGEFNPSETDYGILHHYGPEGSHDTLATGLRRAVDLQVADLDGDDRPEFILCEYGNLRGRLTLLTKGEKVSLLDVPGAIRTQVSDLNGDGRPDIVALVAQGDEGVYILYQTENGGFHPQRVLRLPPIYGTSWFELLDYDGDGDQDLVVVNGDNADYSNFLKPYHGLRLYLNDGQNAFTEAAFIPLYGATRVVAHDFDEDGDYDFAVTAYFPDWEREPAAGFVYLENVESADYDFRLRTTPAAANGRWLVLEKGDYDGDGDMDVALGNFPLFPGRQYPGVAEGWREAGVELLLMENTLR
ncbi:MAG: VCBS repeat-containing protein, partial [Bacteroidota bacterium]